MGIGINVHEARLTRNEVQISKALEVYLIGIHIHQFMHIDLYLHVAELRTPYFSCITNPPLFNGY